MATNGDGPSFFARFIDEPEKVRKPGQAAAQKHRSRLTMEAKDRCRDLSEGGSDKRTHADSRH
jgi:hypothetical protein